MDINLASGRRPVNSVFVRVYRQTRPYKAKPIEKKSVASSHAAAQYCELLQHVLCNLPVAYWLQIVCAEDVKVFADCCNDGAVSWLS